MNMATSLEATIAAPQETDSDPLTRAELTPAQARNLAWRRLFEATVIAAVVAFVIFAAFWYMPFGDSQFNALANWFYLHSTYLILAALSPLMASLLVGYGYMGRAMRRRAAEKALGEPPSA
jgi:hypothetical protein